jgi:hypothetical protein
MATEKLGTGTQFDIAGFRIRWTDMNWIVDKPVTRKRRKPAEGQQEGEEYADWEIVGYYSSLINAVIRVSEEDITNKGKVNLAGLATLLECSKLEIVKAVAEGFERLDKKLLRLKDNNVRNQAIQKVDAAIGPSPKKRRVNTDTGEVHS